MLTEETSSQLFLEDLAILMELGRLFHQQGAVKKNILESDFVSLSNGTIY